ncbi:tyrosine--tRNA ligase [Candidatus Giovannonibacteria bacterium]|nr:tyrosine--tRNA ligase [Candidatus Giovannonibacteria bacterium]
MNIDNKKIQEVLERNVEQIITKEELLKKMSSGKQLRIKHGVDVTSPMLHLGHAVNYWKMREFQEMGHKIIFLIGDFTTTIGDPTGKSKTRPEINEVEIKKNAKDYLRQAAKILINKPKLLEVRRNSEWFGKMKLGGFLSLLKKITHSRLMERDMFQDRIKKQEDIYMHETMYPILQAYDSVMLKSDLTIIGSDQLFNELIGRKYQEIFGQNPQSIITTSITPGLDGGKKMSKSLGNFVAIADSPENQFGKIMTLLDELIQIYFLVYTKLSLEEIENIKKEKPFEAKKKLAFEIVKIYHGVDSATKAKNNFEKNFSKREINEDNLKIYKVQKGEKWADFLVKENFVKSKTEAKRLLSGGGVEQKNKKISQNIEITSGIAKIGKYKFVKIDIL